MLQPASTRSTLVKPARQQIAAARRGRLRRPAGRASRGSACAGPQYRVSSPPWRTLAIAITFSSPHLELGRRDLDQLVALALVEFGQFGDRERQQMAGAGDRHDPVAARRRSPAPAAACRPPSSALISCLAGLVAAGEVLEAGDEAVAVSWTPARSARRCRRWPAPTKVAPAGQREAPAQRLAVAARRGQGVRRGGIAAAGGVEERHLLRAAPAHRLQQAVAIAIAQRRGVDVVALGGADPALLPTAPR